MIQRAARSLSCLPLLVGALWAADAAPMPPRAPYVGLGVSEVTGFDAPRGLRVTEVAPGATAERIGLQVGDLLISVNGTAVQSSDALRTALQSLTDGAALTLVVERNGTATTLSGTVSDVPRPREQAEQSDRLREEAAALRTAAERGTTRTTLEDTLRLLQQIEQDLPKAAEEFKRIYPDGTFRISIQIDIRSDKTAKAAEPLKPAPIPEPAPAPSTPPPAPPTAP